MSFTTKLTITADTSSAVDNVENLTNAQKEQAGATQSSAQEIAQAQAALGLYQEAVVGAAGAVKDFVGDGFELNKNLENSIVSLKEMQGATFDAAEFTQKLNDVSRETGSSVADLTQAAVTLARGGADVAKNLELVNTLATATGQGMEQTGEVIAKAMSGNTEAVNQLAEKYGITKQMIADAGGVISEEGEITAKNAEQKKKLADAIKSVIDSKYSEAIKTHGETMQGVIEDLDSTIDRLKMSMGEELADNFKSLIVNITNLLKKLEQAPPWVKNTAGTIGLLATSIGVLATGLPLAINLWKNITGLWSGAIDIVKGVTTMVKGLTTAKAVETGAEVANTIAVEANTGAQALNIKTSGFLIALKGKITAFWAACTGAVATYTATIGLAVVAIYEYIKAYKELAGWRADAEQRDKEVTEEIQAQRKALNEGKKTAEEWQKYQKSHGLSGSAEEQARSLYQKGISVSDVTEMAKNQRAYTQALTRASMEEGAGPKALEAAAEARKQSQEITAVATILQGMYDTDRKTAEGAIASYKQQTSGQKKVEDATKQNGIKLDEILKEAKKTSTSVEKTASNTDKSKKVESKTFGLPDITATDYPTAKKIEHATKNAGSEVTAGASSPAMAYALATGRAEDFLLALQENPQIDPKRKKIEEQWNLLHPDDQIGAQKKAADELSSVAVSATKAADALQLLYQNAQSAAGSVQNITNNVQINSQSSGYGVNEDAIVRNTAEILEIRKKERAAFSSASNN